MGWLPVRFGIGIVEDKPTEFSCTFKKIFFGETDHNNIVHVASILTHGRWYERCSIHSGLELLCRVHKDDHSDALLGSTHTS